MLCIAYGKNCKRCGNPGHIGRARKRRPDTNATQQKERTEPKLPIPQDCSKENLGDENKTSAETQCLKITVNRIPTMETRQKEHDRGMGEAQTFKNTNLDSRSRDGSPQHVDASMNGKRAWYDKQEGNYVNGYCTGKGHLKPQTPHSTEINDLLKGKNQATGGDMPHRHKTKRIYPVKQLTSYEIAKKAFKTSIIEVEKFLKTHRARCWKIIMSKQLRTYR